MRRWNRSQVLMLVGVLLLGLNLGVLLDRGLDLPRLSAQKREASATSSYTYPRSALVRGDDAAIHDQLSKQYERFEQINRTFELVAGAVSPAVVHIVAQKGVKAGARNIAIEETGSGVIVRPEKDGPEYVLTNNHVIEGSKPAEIEIVLQDGRVLHPDRAWSDSRADIAVLRLSVRDLPAARLGDSDNVAVGTWVLALGSPFGLTHSVSQGIISARNRHEQELQDDGVENQDFLQTDAAINPGNSGGPLVNMKGEVIGINTAIASNGGGSEGVGFSVPVNLARWVMDELISQGRVRRGAMGVKLEDITAPRALEVGLDRPRGARVNDVHANSPAALADLRKGDIIVRFNGADVANLNQLINLVARSPIGREAEVVIWRDRRELSRMIKVGDLDKVLARSERPATDTRAKGGRAPTTKSAEPDSLMGLDLLNIEAGTAKRMGWPEGTVGIGIMRVDPASPLSGHVKALDVIYAVGGKSVRTVDDLARAVNKHTGPNPLEFWVLRPSTSQRFTVKVP